MEINIYDFVDADEIAGIIKWEIQEYVQKNAPSLVSSAAKTVVEEHLNRLLEADGEMRDQMNDAIGNAISGMGFFGLFNNYRGEKSLAYELLEQAVAAQQSNIEHKVRDVVNEIGFSSVEDLVVQAVSNMFWDNRPKDE